VTAARGTKPLGQTLVRQGALAVFGAILLYFALSAPGFFSLANLLNVVEQSTVLGILAFGMAVVVVGGGSDVQTGGIDLSLAANTGLCAAVFAVTSSAGVALPVALLATLGTGLLVGAVNAVAVVRLNILPLLATLAVMNIVAGAELILTQNTVVAMASDFTMALAVGRFLGVSTLAWCLLGFALVMALALHAEGARVGILDGDIYGPSQPAMMGVAEHSPESLDGKSMEPVCSHGVQLSSIGFLVRADQAMIWRGPMAVQALEQLLRQTRWADLDYLVVDLPPGTGDIHLSLTQKMPVTGAVIVTTPQDIALLDARKGLRMFEKVDIPILGVVENMATHVCSHCGHVEAIFGQGGAEKMCADFGVDFLGALPLTMSVRQQADSGCPTVAAEPDGKIAAIYRQIARKVAIKIAQKSKDMTSKFPNIVVKHD